MVRRPHPTGFVAYMPYLILDPTPPTSVYPGPNLWDSSEDLASLEVIYPSSTNLHLESPSPELPVPAPQYTPNGSATVSEEDIEYAINRLDRWQLECLVMSQQEFYIKLSIEAPHHSAESWGEICRESGLLYSPMPPAASQEENGLGGNSTEDTREPSHDYAETLELVTTNVAQIGLASPTEANK